MTQEEYSHRHLFLSLPTHTKASIGVVFAMYLDKTHGKDHHIVDILRVLGCDLE